jgi:hypothetical protein
VRFLRVGHARRGLAQLFSSGLPGRKLSRGVAHRALLGHVQSPREAPVLSRTNFSSVFAALLYALPSACVREHTLFEQGEDGGAGTGGQAGSEASPTAGKGSADGGTPNAGGTGPGAPGAPWDEKSCVAALSLGKAGDACVASFKCTATTGCCQVIALCDAGVLGIQNNCDACVASCTSDGDCGPGRLCDAYECQECTKEACPPTWTSVNRNGCAVCVPPNQCKSEKDPACVDGQICVAGLACLPGCKGDLACCFGNQCAPLSCAPPDTVDCLIVGCAPGSTCKVAGDAVSCACDVKTSKWSCAEPPKNFCVSR